MIAQVGLSILPGAATGFLAQFLAGVLSDSLVKTLAVRNGGIYEAEFRLFLMMPQALLSVIGFVGYGMSIQHGKPLWVVLLFHSFVTCSVPFGSLASLAYIVDSMPTLSQEALVATSVAKSIFVLLFASFINGWLETYGAQRVFVILGSLNLVVASLTVPLYIYGKLLRSWTSRSAMNTTTVSAP